MANPQTSPAPHPLPDDRALAQGLMAQGRLTREQLQHCLAIQQQRGGPAHVSLRTILVEKGVLRQEESTPAPAAQARPKAFVCLSCGAMGQAIPGSPCPKCGTPLPSARGAGASSATSGVAPSLNTTAGNTTPGKTPRREEAQQTVLEPVLASSSPGDGVARSREGDLPSDIAAAAADPKRRIGKYVLVSELGRGGMGVVFRAHDSQLKRTVAIKMILDPTRAGPEALKRFQVEASAAAKLRHPAIVAVYECGEHEGKPYMVLEVVEGGSLEAALKKKKMSFEETAEVVRDIASALAHAHENGVIHRDVKPENVLMDKKGKPHLMDFGLAREVAGSERMTKTGSLLGTPAYMAPEQASGQSRHQGPHTDIYALGGVLYRMLVGRPPFVGETNMEVMQKVMNEEPEPPTRIDPSVPKELEAIALRCLEKDKADRFESAGDVAEELRRWLEGEEVETRSKGAAERAAKGAKKHGKTILAGFLVLAGLGGIVLWAMHAGDAAKAALEDQERQRRDREREEEERKKKEAEAHALEERPKEIAALLERARSGKLESLSDYDDAVEKLAKGGDAVTVKLVAKALDDVVAKLNEAARDQILAAKVPDDDEARAGAGSIDGLETALDRRSAIIPDELDPASANTIRQARKRLDARSARSGSNGGVQALVSAAQARAVGPGGLRLEKLACEVLGRIRIVEGATTSLAKLLMVEEDDGRAFDAASALVRLGAPEAERLAVRRRKQLGPSSGFAKHVLELFPKLADSPDVLVESGLLKAGARDWTGAAADYSRAIEREPACAEAFARRALAKLRLQDPEGALADAGKAIEIAPDLALGWLSRAIVHMEKLGEAKDALADAGKAVELAPELPDAWAWRAFAKRERHDPEGAAADAARAVELDPRSAIAHEARGSVRLDRLDVEGASADLSLAIEIDPNRASTWSKRGRTKVLKRDLEGSIADDTHAIELDASYFPAWNNRGSTKRMRGDLVGAIADFSKAIEIRPNFALLYCNRGQARADNGDLDGGIADQNKALELEPRYMNSLLERASLLNMKGEFERAIQDATTALEIEPRATRALELRAFAKIGKKDHDDEGALADIDRIIELQPEYAPAWANRGMLKGERNDLAGALSDLDRAISLSPQLGIAYIHRGWIRQRKKDLDGARADYDQAFQLDDRFSLLWARRGSLKLLKGDIDGALADSQRAIEIDAKTALAYKTRGDIRRKKGDKKGAQADYEKYVELVRPDDGDLLVVKKALEELRKGR